MGSKENTSGDRFWDLNEPRHISNNLAWGQPWSSGLEAIDTTEIVNLGFTCEVVFMGFALSNSLVSVKICGNYSMLREADYEPFMTRGAY